MTIRGPATCAACGETYDGDYPLRWLDAHFEFFCPRVKAELRGYGSDQAYLRGYDAGYAKAQTLIDHMRGAVGLAIAAMEDLRMDTPEDEETKLRVVETLQLALAAEELVRKKDKRG